MRTYLPSGTADRLPAGWGVRRAARLSFPEAAAVTADPGHARRLRTYLTDMLRPYGLPLDEEAFARGGQSYGEMAQALIHRVVPPGESVDLLVLAHSVPDVTPGRATATWLSHVCPGRPLALAVADESHTAAFTALRLVRAYASGAGLARALLLVVEQPVLPYAPRVPAALPSGAYGVALLLGPPAPGDPHPPLTVATATAGAAPDAISGPGPGGRSSGVPGPNAAPWAAAGAGGLPAGLGAPHRVRVADPGRPGTGVWWELAEEVEESASAPPAAPRRLLLAARAAGPEGGLALAVFDTAAVPVGGRR